MYLLRQPVALAAIISLLACRPVAAQGKTPYSAIDSAESARRHYAAARDAARANDLAEAQRHLMLAATAWPGQSSYMVNVASIAARRGDNVALAGALSRLAILEAGGQLLTDTSIVRLATADTSVGNARRALEQALASTGNSRVQHELHDSTIFPEGNALDTRTGAMYVTSIRHRTVVEISRDGRERDVLPRSQPSMGAMLAVRVDPDGNHLWVTTAGMPSMAGYTTGDSATAALLRIRIKDGHVTNRWDLGNDGRRIPGDIAMGPDGDVFVSDSRTPVIYRLRRSSNKLETFAHPYFRSLQGMAFSRDGRTLYVADYSHGLLRVNLDDNDVQLVQHNNAISTLGLDGITLHGSSIVAVQNGSWPARVVRYELAPSGLQILSARTVDRIPQIADEPTNGIIDGNDFVYVANSQWEKYDENGKRRAGQRLEFPKLLRVPLGPVMRPPR